MNLLKRASELDRDIHGLHMKCSFKLFEEANIHPGQPPILKTIQNLGSSNQCEIAKILGTSPASVGVSIKRLEKSGYVIKRPDEKDIRSNTISLTEKGNEIATKSEENLKILMEKKLEGFSEEEMQQFISFLERIHHNIEAYQRELYGRM